MPSVSSTDFRPSKPFEDLFVNFILLRLKFHFTKHLLGGPSSFRITDTTPSYEESKDTQHSLKTEETGIPSCVVMINRSWDRILRWVS